VLKSANSLCQPVEEVSAGVGTMSGRAALKRNVVMDGGGSVGVGLGVVIELLQLGVAHAG
jgi:hypothetical protein